MRDRIIDSLTPTVLADMLHRAGRDEVRLQHMLRRHIETLPPPMTATKAVSVHATIQAKHIHAASGDLVAFTAGRLHTQLREMMGGAIPYDITVTVEVRRP